MSDNEIFESCVRSADDLAGVFEYDGETGYFYLYASAQPEGEKVQDSIHILSEPPDFLSDDVSIRWDSDEKTVGLFIEGTLWAVFDAVRRSKFGGNYKRGTMPAVPEIAMRGFLST